MKKKRGKKFKAAVGGIAVVILAAGVFVGVRTLHAQKTPSEGTVKQSTTVPLRVGRGQRWGDCKSLCESRR